VFASSPPMSCSISRQFQIAFAAVVFAAFASVLSVVVFDLADRERL